MIVEYNGLTLHLYASTIRDDHDRVVGSAALIRDISDEKRLEEQLRKLSTTDGLTTLYNRRFLDEAITTEFHRALRTRSPLSVILLDIDHFKRFNDTHGHARGDQVLRAVAQAMRSALRKYDLPCRYGGEEFLAILPNTDPQGAFAVAERIRTSIEQMSIDGHKVTASLGVATFPVLAVETPEELIGQADEALYRAKASGRNRIVVSPPAQDETGTT